ncbi:MAG: hypothetical protein A2Z91_07005 [Deltaproteobacteria bacterium GWA2_38_16]|nr:MAG: hypothetical protein A2Z91_07005 [Deltaproteobacteria bacterium GWA2_38_16]OGQ02380.1 MAG: hypothetical protein A3D19_06020 [Deltaproteobacteria bacterium RIFCSPHIGHO2_02_FULL_38_15]OGQ62342.1 MAG: hypothetical protein A3G92_06270 [Deltaproteobacteria bacterium RIFCSPLOWO2_12_FULL_38_8]HBQ20715.1 hypothetical protein [Deltaproteobacteria bacterium]
MKHAPASQYHLKDRQEFYDKTFKTKDIQDHPSNYRSILKILEILRYAQDDHFKFLDISCGSGRLLQEIKDLTLKTFGGDFSKTALDLAKARCPKTNFILFNGEKLPFKNDTFYMATNCGSLEHYEHPQMGISEMSRVLKKGGKALIIVPNSFQWRHIVEVFWRGGLKDSWQTYDLHLTKSDWIKLIQENGLKVLKTYKFEDVPELIQWNKGQIKLKSFKKFLRDLLAKYLFPLNFTKQFMFLCAK